MAHRCEIRATRRRDATRRRHRIASRVDAARDAARDAVRDAAPTRSNDDFDLDDDD
jgi:hypothetical protein